MFLIKVHSSKQLYKGSDEIQIFEETNNDW